ncbi:hypothetical protein [Rhizobium miluonense]|uniref:Uncharacterized protein n=1 Tax=Rhizobium miluonense TaxID=411945 RepID=A0A1C3VXA3_9HYPH|nr:hypothetical protein [Rhizobium miluonense]SCB32293.1 hypothetical protein GA0061102_101957 [Rhizobium miluonense]
MNNIIPFRERTFATKLSAAPVLSAPAFSPSPARTAPFQRPRLIAVWHTNPQTGKQECFWTTEGNAISDEDGSRRAA